MGLLNKVVLLFEGRWGAAVPAWKAMMMRGWRLAAVLRLHPRCTAPGVWPLPAPSRSPFWDKALQINRINAVGHHARFSEIFNLAGTGTSALVFYNAGSEAARAEALSDEELVAEVWALAAA
jgi:hypothetical protein